MPAKMCLSCSCRQPVWECKLQIGRVRDGNPFTIPDACNPIERLARTYVTIPVIQVRCIATAECGHRVAECKALGLDIEAEHRRQCAEAEPGHGSRSRSNLCAR